MKMKIKVKHIIWDVPESELGLEPLPEDSEMDLYFKRALVEIPEKIKELCPYLPEEVDVEVDISENDLYYDDGTVSIFPGVLANIISDKLKEEYNYGASVLGDFIVMEGDIKIVDD